LRKWNRINKSPRISDDSDFEKYLSFSYIDQKNVEGTTYAANRELEKEMQIDNQKEIMMDFKCKLVPQSSLAFKLLPPFS
jgi:hypothetical protein